MVILAGKGQIPLVNKIHQMEYRTLLVNIYEDSPAFEYADYNEVSDILDKERCLEIAPTYDIDAIVSDEFDISMPTVAYVAENLGLPSWGSKYVSIYTNKNLMRELSAQHSLLYVKHKLCKTVAEVEQFYDDLKHDINIKSLGSCGSRGVF